MSKGNTDWGQMIFLLLILLFVPIPLLFLVGSIFGTGVLIILGLTIPIVLWQLTIGAKIKTRKRIEELKLKDKSGTELKELLAQELSANLTREDVKAIKITLKQKEKFQKLLKKKSKDNIFKNIFCTILAIILLHVGLIFLLYSIGEYLFRINPNLADDIIASLISIRTVIICLVLSYPVQRIFRFKSLAFKTVK